MSGQAVGKLQLKKAKVVLQPAGIELGAVIYIHLRGFAFARVTHLDIEHDVLDKIIQPKRGYFLNIHRIGKGIQIKLDKEKRIRYKGKQVGVSAINIIHPYLSFLDKTRTWVGGKAGGIYIGFRKEHIKELEKIAKQKFKNY
jgi:hypothetical protein